jgi:outer membrane receptor protein involved in Fe transport
MGDATVYQFDENYEVIDTAMYEKNKIYNTYADGIEPRLSMTFIINPFTTVKASYVRTRQYVQLAQNSTAGTPMDFWFPVSPNVKPQSANQYSLGIFRNLAKNTVETSLEAYYKDMDNTIDFKDHANLLFNPEIEGELRVGTSKAYGLEFMTKINRRKLNGWISYTLSRSERTIPGINDGKTYLSPYDKTHDVSLVLQYKLSERWNLSANWIYATGNPVTFPAGRMRIENMIVPVFTERNAYRLPDYHRLDLGATYQFKHNPAKKWRHELNFSIYNVYNHKNAWAINFKEDEDNPDVIIAEKVYLFPIIPSITYNFKF